MTQRDFATRRGVGLSTLSKWLRCECKPTSPPVKFKEVVLPNTSLRYAVEVVSPQGWIVRLQNGSDEPVPKAHYNFPPMFLALATKSLE